MSGLQVPHFGLKRQYNNLTDELLDATDRALKAGQLVGGHYTRSFEQRLKNRAKATYAVTGRGVLSLPIYPELTDSEVEYIADKVREQIAK